MVLPFLPWVRAAFALSSVGWCCLVFLLWVVLPFFLSFWWDYFSPVFARCCFSNLLSGGAAFLPPPFGGAAFHHLLWGLGRVPRLPCWVVLLSCPPLSGGAFLLSRLLGRAAWFSSIGRCCFFSSPFGGIALIHLLWVELFFFPSSVGWCCLVHRVVLRCFFFLLRGAAFLSLHLAELRSSLLLGGVAVQNQKEKMRQSGKMKNEK